MAESEDLYQIALLIDQLKHDDLQLRINASGNITKIARALGVDRTRDELVPFLEDCVEDEDEVIVIIAEQLGVLSDFVGGNEHMHVLLSPLEMLICGEESTVRNMGISSIEAIVSKMDDKQVATHFHPFLKKLANKDWFTARGSAAALIHLGYSRLSDDALRSEMLDLFVKLCTDETPLVRRVAAQHLTDMVGLVKSKPALVAQLITIFKAIARDDQDSIRIQIISICVSICAFVSLEIKTRDILPEIVTMAKDTSWRVRWSVAHRMHHVMSAVLQGSSYTSSGTETNGGSSLSPDPVTTVLSDMSSGVGAEESKDAVALAGALTSLASVYDGLLNDTEAEVRAAASSHLSAVCKFLTKDTILKCVIPTSQRLASDSSDFVRAFFASEVNNLAPSLGRDEAVQCILPLLLTLLRDESSEVRLNVISNLDVINSVIGVELLSQALLPAIADLAQDSKWRVRLAVIENVPMLAKQLGVKFFDEKLIELCMTWLADNVYSIRKAAAINLNKLSSIFGEEWSRRQILPKITELHNIAGYSKRLTALFALQVLLRGFSRSSAESQLLPLVLEMSKDPVANVRFNVAKTLHTAVQVFQSPDTGGREGTVPTQITSILATLAADGDRDVRYYAGIAIKSVKKANGGEAA